MDGELEKVFEDYLKGGIVWNDKEAKEVLKGFLKAKFTPAAKALFKREAGVFFINNNFEMQGRPEYGVMLYYIKDGETSPTRHSPRKSKNMFVDWLALNILHAISKGEQYFENPSEIEDWLEGFEFDKTFIDEELGALTKIWLLKLKH